MPIVLYILKNPVYVGKIQWRRVLHDGHHDPLISQVLYERVQAVLQRRNEESKGRQWHNGDERVLTGIIRCARCKSHMFGHGCKKKGVYIPYYACSKRTNKHECDQDYVRAEDLESSIVQDLKAIFLDEAFVAWVWEEANRKLGAEKPDVEKELSRVGELVAKTRATVERYFEAF